MPQRIYMKRPKTPREEVQPTEGPVEATEQAKADERLQNSAEVIQSTEVLLDIIDKTIESVGRICVVFN